MTPIRDVGLRAARLRARPPHPIFAPEAQLDEHRTTNPGVACSTHARCTLSRESPNWIGHCPPKAEKSRFDSGFAHHSSLDTFRLDGARPSKPVIAGSTPAVSTIVVVAQVAERLGRKFKGKPAYAGLPGQVDPAPGVGFMLACRMSRITQARKSEQLGMDVGTATHHLRQALMFSFAKRLGETFCFRCREEILTASDMSLDHMATWLDVDPALFWDVGNVALSHKRCNRPDRPGGPPKKECAEGMLWCTSCQGPQPIALFGVNRAIKRGFSQYCKVCLKSRNWHRGKRQKEIIQP